MAVERRDPLPPGRYWTFILERELGDWQRWVSEHQGEVHVVAAERKSALAPFLPAVFATRPDGSIIMDAKGAWFLFDVLEPVPWVGFGFPTIVTDLAITSSSQVEQAPDPEPDGGAAEGVWREVKNTVLLGGAIYLGGVLLTRYLR
jgi:hypothetical protein